MKFFKVFSLVVIGHALLIGAFLLQPGCQSIDKQWEEHRREKQNVQVPREVLAQEQGLPVDSEEIDPSFNSGFVGDSNRPRAKPTRPAGKPVDASEVSFAPEPSESLFNPGLADGFNSGAEPIEPSPTSGYVPYTVQSGDTLWGLSKEYNVSFAALLEANGMDRNSQLRLGQEILVPSGYGDIPEASQSAMEPQAADGTTIYEVRRGDTLSEIAVRSGTSVSRIKTLNNMSSDRIRIGQKLIVPDEIVVTESPEMTRSVEIDITEYTMVHEVRSGQTPSGIANQYGMTVDELLVVNEIDNPRNLRAGAKLKVKPASLGSKSSGASSAPSATILPSRASGVDLPAPVRSSSAVRSTEESSSAAPEIIPPSTPNRVDPEVVVEDDGFGEEIMDLFDGVEEVPAVRSDAEGG